MRLPKRQTKKQVHAEIQNGVRDYLIIHHWMVKRMKAGPFSEKGLADLITLKNGFHRWIEIKISEDDPLKADQEEFKQEVEDHGGEYWVIWSIDQLEVFKKLGKI